MKCLFLFCAVLLAYSSSAQLNNIHGTLADTSGKPVPNAAVSLLDPSDSTMIYFGISDQAGQFRINSVKAGNYLLQAASPGYKIYFRSWQQGAKEGDLGYLILHPVSQLLDEFEVKSRKVPMLLKGDTVEYNASAFKVKRDAVAEDLLRKLPGIQLDKSGNIRAQGKDVKKVLVDGKEFFGDDPKMASKNLPADAIDKVQVFGSKSDAVQFTGIDDGERDQTINLQLKDNKRRGYFGDEEIGGGTDGHYRVNAKLYRFQPKTQFSLLGMLNNINQFGFTFQDYLSFQGGLRGAMDGNGIMGSQMRRDMPVNFGQAVRGLITSGGAGVNYSTTEKASRFSISYLGNGAEKELSEQSYSQNFRTGNSFTTNEDQQQTTRDFAHRLNLSWRKDLDSTQQLVLRANATYTDNTTSTMLLSSSSFEDTVRNSLNSQVNDKGNGLDAGLSASYLKRFRRSAWPIWKLNASVNFESSDASTNWNNASRYFGDTATYADRQYQNNDSRHLTSEAGISVVRKLNPGYYLEPSLRAGIDNDAIVRRQGLLPGGLETDSLSPDFGRIWRWIRPGVAFRHNTQKTQLSLGLNAASGQLSSEVRGTETGSNPYAFLLPSFYYQNAYAQGRQLTLNYGANIAPPSSLQMLPVTNYQNPLQRLTGNALLRPEYRHMVQANWMRFDQFSSTSIMAHLRGVYTQDKISFSRHIQPDLSEDAQYVNTPDDYLLNAGGSYNTPLRQLGLKLNVELDERYTLGQSLVNDVRNKNAGFNHNLRVSVSNRAQKAWDIECGAEADITQTSTSLNSMGDTWFYHYNGSARISYKPDGNFHLSLIANLDQYKAPGFPDAVTIPLVNASASWYFLNSRRGVLTLDIYDLLNRNTSVQRISQLNYFLERRSNIIRQYFLLSFKYRLSKSGGKSAVSIDVRGR